MNKDEILEEIKSSAKKNGGKPLGQEKFAKETGIKISDWHGKYWVRWSQALLEAGFEPNTYNSAYDDDYLLEKLAAFTLELKHYPVKAEFKIKARVDKDFPSHTSFDRFGGKQTQINKLLDFASNNEQFKDVIQFLPNKESIVDNERSSGELFVSKGYVYLMKHGSRQEYKIGRTNNPIRREGELTIELRKNSTYSLDRNR